MPGRPPKVTHLRMNFLADLESARSLVAAALPLQRIAPSGRLHPKHVRRVVELAFLGIVAEWEDFLEQAFVRYLCGARTNDGYAPVLAAGRARDIGHAYELISQNTAFDPTKHYLKFWDTTWALQRARFFFRDPTPFASVQRNAARLHDAVKIRNRVAHSSKKAKTEFKTVAIRYVNPSGNTLSQGYRVGDLLLSPATRCFGSNATIKDCDYFAAFTYLLASAATEIVP